ncbi:hypothetical protein K432DRAFT_391435 [Lepidopterella palustris CBS 459.81]|uniref:Uncharacterized protein n=1 Tax=Lepidopterella palustris CBS 459.81 TaxID=1314670 RepID=A0A8E2EE19_9PEZI|nr:hypothetical protein K432DRAFT_391435 [Lepidopterella palustris CBS 459.81]
MYIMRNADSDPAEPSGSSIAVQYELKAKEREKMDIESRCASASAPNAWEPGWGRPGALAANPEKKKTTEYNALHKLYIHPYRIPLPFDMLLPTQYPKASEFVYAMEKKSKEELLKLEICDSSWMLSQENQDELRGMKYKLSKLYAYLLLGYWDHDSLLQAEPEWQFDFHKGGYALWLRIDVEGQIAFNTHFFLDAPAVDENRE